MSPKAALALLLAAVLVASCMSRQDIDEEQARYCKNVAEGVWPDYKKIFEKSCKKS